MDNRQERSSRVPKLKQIANSSGLGQSELVGTCLIRATEIKTQSFSTISSNRIPIRQTKRSRKAKPYPTKPYEFKKLTLKTILNSNTNQALMNSWFDSKTKQISKSLTPKHHPTLGRLQKKIGPWSKEIDRRKWHSILQISRLAREYHYISKSLRDSKANYISNQHPLRVSK